MAGFPDFRGESKTATWVYRIALYTCISFVRRRMRRPQSVRLSVDLACDDDMQAREQLDELYAVISRLGRLDRALILLWLEERPAGGDRRHHGPVSRQCGRETDPYPLQTA